MKFRILWAILACKVLTGILRLFGRGGTAIPGKLALQMCPQLLGKLAKDVHCVVITGTNGKTTSARMIEEIFAKAKTSYFANRSGANLIGGITAEFVEHSTMRGKPLKKYAIIECDEAASKEVCRYLDPDCILVTNVFRDQLDRFGDVSNTLESILLGIYNSPHAKVCLNADCPLTSSLANRIDNTVFFYGVDTSIYKSPVSEIDEAAYCPRCKVEYEYSYRTFGYLGGFYCPKCGTKREWPIIAVSEIKDCGLDTTKVKMRIFNEYADATINLPGAYNIYNAIGAMAVSQAMLIDPFASINALSTFSCGFGRMEQFDMGQSKARMILVKNATGFNQVINYLSELTDKTLFVCCINDNTGDGTDISWIWDVRFERLAELTELFGEIYVSGIRRDDMAVRLKYAGIPTEHIRVFDNYDELIKSISSQELPVVIAPTYSAMMELRAKMSAAFGGKDFWE